MKYAVLMTVLLLQGCTLPNAGKVLFGISQVQQAPQCYQSLVEFLGDTSAIEDELTFFIDAYEAAEAFGFDESFIQFAGETPQFIDNAAVNFKAIETNVINFAGSEGVPVPAELVACSAGLKAGWSVLEEAIETSDTTQTVLEYARLIKPILALIVL